VDNSFSPSDGLWKLGKVLHNQKITVNRNNSGDKKLEEVIFKYRMTALQNIQ